MITARAFAALLLITACATPPPTNTPRSLQVHHPPTTSVVRDTPTRASRHTRPPAARRTPPASNSRPTGRGTPPRRTPLTDAQLHRLLLCESHRNYQAVSATGRYRGAAQWARSTWRAAARLFAPDYAGADPIHVPPAVQDRVTRGWWITANPWRQWPICASRAVRGDDHG